MLTSLNHWFVAAKLVDPPIGQRLLRGKVGSFDGDIGEFFARDVVAGKKVVVKFHWDKRNPEAPIWSAAFSVDEGQTWEWNWYAYFARH